MLKVLLVDDDPSLLAGLRRALLGQPPQWEVHLAKEASAGLDLLAGEHIDLVISDMRMPGMDGAAFLHKVKEAYPYTVRVILSGYSEDESSIRSLDVAHQFLAKPCSPQRLMGIIEHARGFCEQLDIGLRSALASIAALPSPPEAVKAFESALEDRVPASALTEVVASDIALTAKMLQLANSAFFSESVETVDVQEAVGHLGVGRLAKLVREAEICMAFESDPGRSVEALQSHAQVVSQVASSLYPPESKLAKTAGMLHDVGALALASIPERQFDPAWNQYSESLVGGWLLAIWGLPAPLIEAVCDYENDPSPFDTEMNTVHALRLAEVAGSKVHPGWKPAGALPSGYPASLGVDLDSL